MNRQHPIDDLFRSRLEGYGQEAPMHVWDAIERNRAGGKPRRKLLALWLLLPTAVVTTFAIGAYLMTVNGNASSVEIGSFPIPIALEKSTAEATINTTNEITLPDHQNQQTLSDKNYTESSATVIASKKSTGTAKSKTSKVMDAAVPVVLGKNADMQHKGKDEISEAAAEKQPMHKKWASANLSLKKPRGLNDGALELPKKIFPPDPKCARFSRGYWYHYVDLTVAPGFAFRNFEALDSEYENYLKQREKTEKSHYALSAGVRLTAMSGTGLAASAGLNYTRITEAFDYLNENEVVIIIRDLHGPNGEFLGRDTSYQSGTRRIIKYNQYQMLEVPLAVGYNLRGSKFDLLMSAGVRLNLLFLPKGAFLSPEDLQPVNFSYDRSDAYPAFKKHLEAGWFLSAGLAYKWKTDFHFLVEPHLSYYPREFTRPDYPISQKYWLMGISLGIRKRL